MPEASTMDAIVSLAKRRGFVYQASEIYGGLRGFWDYGPLGVLLKNAVRDSWWRAMVECPPIGPDGHPVEIVGLDSSIIQHPKTWKASGHVDTFADPMRKCAKCGHILRADHLPNLLATSSKWHASLMEMLPDGGSPDTEALLKWARRDGRKLAPNLAAVRQPEQVLAAVAVRGLADRAEVVRGLATEAGSATMQDPCPLCGGELGEAKPFNLMLDTYPGPERSEENKAYLRPETAQGIFLNFKNISDTTRVKVPFGVAQIGKSFRNEVTPRNFIFRSREFEQMEMEFFCPPDDALMWFQFWRQERMKWWLSLGIRPENLRFYDTPAKDLAHYARASTDIEYLYPFTAPDFGELEGVAHRGNYDLTQHSTHSGQKLDYFDQELQLKLKEQGVGADEIKARSRYVPHVIEPAAGLTRGVLVLLCEAYRYDESRPSKEYFAFKPSLAPVKAGIFPLVNKDGMPEIGEKLYLDLRKTYAVEYDPKQSIGKRYARMDEIGTPFSITIDGDTTAAGTVTVRHRDSQQQEKVGLEQVGAYLAEKLAE